MVSDKAVPCGLYWRSTALSSELSLVFTGGNVRDFLGIGSVMRREEVLAFVGVVVKTSIVGPTCVRGYGVLEDIVA